MVLQKGCCNLHSHCNMVTGLLSAFGVPAYILTFVNLKCENRYVVAFLPISRVGRGAESFHTLTIIYMSLSVSCLFVFFAPFLFFVRNICPRYILHERQKWGGGGGTNALWPVLLELCLQPPFHFGSEDMVPSL